MVDPANLGLASGQNSTSDQSATKVVWTEILTRLVSGEDFDLFESTQLMREILKGSVPSAQLAAFLVLLRAKGETEDEVNGFLTAIREFGVGVQIEDTLGAPVIDMCGTGGDLSGTINVSTAASFVVAGAGVLVAKHGNRAASSLSGAADVLEALGAKIDLGPSQVVSCLQRVGLAFLMAPVFHPAFRHAGSTRKELGIPTIMNYLGPLSNPASVRRQIVGVGNPKMAELLINVLRDQSAEHAMVVYGHDGLDEISVTDKSTIFELKDGRILEYEFDPMTLGIDYSDPELLKGSSPKHNAKRIREILSGDKGPQTNFVLVNAAGALVVAGQAECIGDGFEIARSVIETGKAFDVLESFVKTTNEL